MKIKFKDLYEKAQDLFSNTIDILNDTKEDEFIYEISLLVFDYKKGFYRPNEIIFELRNLKCKFEEVLNNFNIEVVRLVFIILCNIYEMMEQDIYEKN